MTLGKRVFLFVRGGDSSAMDFEQNFNTQSFYEDMVREGVKKVTINTDSVYAEVEIREFKEIDSDFITFVHNHFIDYDFSKATNFIEVKPTEEVETVTISKKEYDYLLKQDHFLSCLEACGVDNWSGYSYAREMQREEEDEE